MPDENTAPVDLLGDPWSEPKDKRGRPAHRRNALVAEKVAVLRAGGLTVEQIATRMRMTAKTLSKHYYRELQDGVTLARAMVVEAMYEKAKTGVVGAARFIREEFEKGAAAVPVPKRAGAPLPAPAVDPEPEEEAPLPRPEKLGKKAEADRAAKTAHKGTGWGDLLN